MKLLLALACALFLAPNLGAQVPDNELDLLTPLKGKPLEVRILERYNPTELVYWHKKKRKTMKHTKVGSMVTQRDRLRTLLGERKEGLTLQQEWDLVGRALELKLPRMARILAYHVLTLDPQHAGANELLGHAKKSKGWRWKLGKKSYEPGEFSDRILHWDERLVLTSEHYRVECNTGLRIGIDTIIDLERLYLGWMERLGKDLQAGEWVLYPDNGPLVFFVFRTSKDDGFIRYRDSLREPFYDPSKSFSTDKGEWDLAVTYMGADDYRPLQLFDLGARQLLYALTVRSKNRSAPIEDVQKHYAHWAEWGLGYWIERQVIGKPGYAKWQAFSMQPEVARSARQMLKRGPLKSPNKELPNMLGLPVQAFHRGSNERLVYRDKSRALVAFLMEENVDMMRGTKVKGKARDGFYYYLREAYGTSTANSSSKFDDGLGGVKLETLRERWYAWMHAQ